MYKTDSTDAVTLLTEKDRQQIDARARRDLLKAVGAQALVSVVVGLICWAVAGLSSAAWSFAGSGAYLLPNAVFALRLLLATYRPAGASPLVFFVGEFLKVGASIGLLWAIAHFGGDQVQWLAVVAGLIATVKGYVVMLMFKGFRAR